MKIKAISPKPANLAATTIQPEEAQRETAPIRITRRAQLASLLKRDGGATLTSLEKRFGWQPHTVRAAISGLRKSGCTIERSVGKSGAVCRIVQSVNEQ